MASVDDYITLVPSENRDKPKFMALVSLVAGAFADTNNAIRSIETKLDLDTAEGDQLDIIGKWVGLSRTLQVPFAVFFSMDITGLGFDQGNWKGPYDPTSGVTVMDDGTYRLMLKAKIGANNWDGTMPSFLAILSEAFQGSGITITARDNQDMTMDVYLSAKPPALLAAILTGGYLPIKPEGVTQTLHIPS